MSFIFVEIYSSFESSLTSWLAVECISKAYVPFIRFFVSLALSAFSRLFALFLVMCAAYKMPNQTENYIRDSIFIFISDYFILFFFSLVVCCWLSLFASHRFHFNKNYNSNMLCYVLCWCFVNQEHLCIRSRSI